MWFSPDKQIKKHVNTRVCINQGVLVCLLSFLTHICPHNPCVFVYLLSLGFSALIPEIVIVPKMILEAWESVRLARFQSTDLGTHTSHMHKCTFHMHTVGTRTCTKLWPKNNKRKESSLQTEKSPRFPLSCHLSVCSSHSLLSNFSSSVFSFSLSVLVMITYFKEPAEITVCSRS